MKYVILIISIAILLLPSATHPDKPPAPEPVKQDLLDKETDNYRQLLSDVWNEYSAKRPSFKTDEEALKWINDRQTAAWKAAYPEFVKRAADSATDAAKAKSFSEALKNRSL